MGDTQKTIGIVGFGNMGSSIGERLKAEYKVWAFDKDRAKTKNISGINAADSVKDLINKVSTLILAVKPQDIDSVLREIKNSVKDKLIIPIAAGISTAYIEKLLGAAHIIRAMPNIGLKIGESVTCLCKGKFASDEDLSFAKELFYSLGVTEEIDEEMMNAATAISGSGPAYIFDFIEANSIDPNAVPEHTLHDLIKRLERAAISLGFAHEEAMFLAVNTANASIELMKATKIEPAELKKQVSSKGGTTEAALEVLHKGATWEEAAQAALKRAQDLARR